MGRRSNINARRNAERLRDVPENGGYFLASSALWRRVNRQHCQCVLYVDGRVAPRVLPVRSGGFASIGEFNPGNLTPITDPLFAERMDTLLKLLGPEDTVDIEALLAEGTEQ